MKKRISCLAAVICLLGALSKGINVCFPLLTQHIIDSVLAQGSQIGILLVILCLASLGIVISDIGQTYVSQLFRNNCRQYYRKKIAGAVYQKTSEEFYSVNQSDYVSIFNHNIDAVIENYYMTAFTILKCCITLVGSIISLIYLDFRLMLVVMLVSVFPLVNPLLFGKKLNAKRICISESLKELNGELSDFLGGFLFAKSCHLKNVFIQKLVKSGENANSAELDYVKTSMESNLLSGLLGYGGYILTIVGGIVLIRGGHISIGALFAALQISDNIAPPITSFSHLVNQMLSVKGMKTELEQLAGDDKEESMTGRHIRGIENISLENVTIQTGETEILHKVSFSFEKGKKYVVVGPSGAGKSTLLKLLMQIYTPAEGSVKINGILAQQIEENDFFSNIGIMNQEPFFMNDSIENNIFLYHQSTEEDRLRVENFLNLGNLLQRVSWQMNCRNGAYRLSGGERQRIALARLAYQKKDVLLLDEPVSSLDVSNRRLFEEWVSELKDCIVIHVSHFVDPEVLKKYDEILFMENGEIRISGKYEELTEETVFREFIMKRKHC